MATPSSQGNAAAASAAAAGSASSGFAVVLVLAPCLDSIYVKVFPNKTLLLQQPFELLEENAVLRPLIVAYFERISDRQPVYEISDAALQLLHTLLQMEKQLVPVDAILSVALVTTSSLQIAVTHALKGKPLVPTSSAPTMQPLFRDKKPLRLQVCFCNVKQAAAIHNVRTFFIPSSLTSLSSTATQSEQKQALETLLSGFLHAELQPPPSWTLHAESKRVVYNTLGADYQLSTNWIPMETEASLPALAIRMLKEVCPSGSWYVKGDYSHSGLSSFRIDVENGKCAKLLPTLQTLFNQQKQRWVGVQRFVPALLEFEMRVFVMRDARAAAGGWRQVLSVVTNNCEGKMEAELAVPLHGRPLAVTHFIEQLLSAHEKFFERAAVLGIPGFRVDCGWDPVGKRCFVNELTPVGDTLLYSHVHQQDLAFVVGREFATMILRQ